MFISKKFLLANNNPNAINYLEEPMKQLLIATATFMMAFAAQAGMTTAVHTVRGNLTDAEIQDTISKINRDRIRVFGCSHNQKVYAFNIVSGDGSYVADAHGNFRPRGGKVVFKVRCSE
jgi:hypothetical protein